jgi:hypothetical protein
MNATATQTRRQHQPLKPVNVRAYFVGGATRQDVVEGEAVPSITDLDHDEEAAYWPEVLFDGERCVGFRVRKFGGEETPDVSRDLLSCMCGAATSRSQRPGGCRHQKALREALPTVAKDASALRKTHTAERAERDEQGGLDYTDANANDPDNR